VNQLPQEFCDLISKSHGLSELEISFFLQKPDKSMRVNQTKMSEPNLEKVPWCDTGFWLKTHPVFHHDPCWHGGAYFVQNASSMLIELAWKQVVHTEEKSLKILDMCASPGGKSTHLASLMSKDDFLVTNEYDRKRSLPLKDNMMRWGNPNVVVTNSTPENLKTSEAFDLILVDAPCSGEGLFAEYPKAIQQWSPQLIDRCAIRQKDILKSADLICATGGHLIYSTCTSNPSENKEIIAWMMEDKGYKVIPLVNTSSGLTPIQHRDNICGYQVFPHQMNSRSFFFSLLKKTSTASVLAKQGRKHKSKQRKESAKAIGPLHVKQPYKAWLKDFLNNNRIVYYGDEAHELGDKAPALQLPYRTDAPSDFEVVSLDAELACQYLKGEALPALGSPGWNIVSYQDVNLGWIKVLANRSNNYFPKPWRIPPSTKESDLLRFSII